MEGEAISKRRLGRNGPEVGAVGYGAMALAGYYGAAEEDQGIEAIQRALDLGATMVDTADAYADGANEVLVGRALEGRRDEAFVATKFGIVFAEGEEATDLTTGWGFSLPINGTPDYAQRALEGSLKRLGVDVIDLWYLHYPDPSLPVERSIEAMARAVEQGTVRALGLSNATADEVRRAHAVHPLGAVQYEYSIWRREPERKLLPTVKELDIGFVPWSPLGSGFLTGDMGELDDSDFRKLNPRISGESAERNRDRFAPIHDIARELGLTSAQLALAWLLHRGDAIVPIPGTRRAARMEENAAAAEVELPDAVLERIDELLPVGAAEGATLV